MFQPRIPPKAFPHQWCQLRDSVRVLPVFRNSLSSCFVRGRAADGRRGKSLANAAGRQSEPASLLLRSDQLDGSVAFVPQPRCCAIPAAAPEALSGTRSAASAPPRPRTRQPSALNCRRNTSTNAAKTKLRRSELLLKPQSRVYEAPKG